VATLFGRLVLVILVAEIQTELFQRLNLLEQVVDPQIKMVEIKLSQGAKPGHGGVLPGPKVTAEIALTRGVPAGEDCVSPASHSAFSSPIELMQFIAHLRKLSGWQAHWL
jgi:glutamate synthase domain-containing protein 2